MKQCYSQDLGQGIGQCQPKLQLGFTKEIEREHVPHLKATTLLYVVLLKMTSL